MIFQCLVFISKPADTPSIIAVTGLAGHAFGSWAHCDESMWLRDYLPRYADNARILTYGYPSELNHNQSFSTLQDYTSEFVQRLVHMRAVAKVKLKFCISNMKLTFLSVKAGSIS